MKNLLLNYLNSGNIGILLSIVFGLLAIYLYFIGKKQRKPTYIVRTIRLVSSKLKDIDNIKISYAGANIENLSISKIALWNAGKETINSADIPPTSPIKLEIEPKYEFLGANILYQKKVSNNFKLEMSSDKKSVLIKFDYFDYEEGVVLQVFHTGNESNDIKLTGDIKASKGLSKKTYGRTFLIGSLTKISYRRSRSIYRHSIYMCSIIMAIFAVFEYNIRDINYIPHINKNTLIFILVIYSIIFLLFGYSIKDPNIPKGFNIFYEEFLDDKLSKSGKAEKK
jgi:hypothetical protein